MTALVFYTPSSNRDAEAQALAISEIQQCMIGRTGNGEAKHTIRGINYIFRTDDKGLAYTKDYPPIAPPAYIVISSLKNEPSLSNILADLQGHPDILGSIAVIGFIYTTPPTKSNDALISTPTTGIFIITDTETAATLHQNNLVIGDTTHNTYYKAAPDLNRTRPSSYQQGKSTNKPYPTTTNTLWTQQANRDPSQPPPTKEGYSNAVTHRQQGQQQGQQLELTGQLKSQVTQMIAEIAKTVVTTEVTKQLKPLAQKTENIRIAQVDIEHKQRAQAKRTSTMEGQVTGIAKRAKAVTEATREEVLAHLNISMNSFQAQFKKNVDENSKAVTANLDLIQKQADEHARTIRAAFAGPPLLVDGLEEKTPEGGEGLADYVEDDEKEENGRGAMEQT
jgi:hypothetical protein